MSYKLIIAAILGLLLGGCDNGNTSDFWKPAYWQAGSNIHIADPQIQQQLKDELTKANISYETYNDKGKEFVAWRPEDDSSAQVLILKVEGTPPPKGRSSGWADEDDKRKLLRNMEIANIPYSTAQYYGHEYIYWDKQYSEKADKIRNVRFEESVIGDYNLLLHIGEYDRALSLVKQHAHNGDPYAQHAYAVEFFRSKSVFAEIHRDESKAFEWFYKAADQGLAKSMAQIGQMLEHGDGVKVDNEKKALEWYKKAADKNDPFGMWKLAKFYELGLGGLNKDLKLAESYYKKVNDAGADFSFLESNYQ